MSKLSLGIRAPGVNNSVNISFVYASVVSAQYRGVTSQMLCLRVLPKASASLASHAALEA